MSTSSECAELLAACVGGERRLRGKFVIHNAGVTSAGRGERRMDGSDIDLFHGLDRQVLCCFSTDSARVRGSSSTD